MKASIISKIRLNKSDSMTSIVKKNSLYSLILKLVSVCLSFWSVRVAYEFTGSQQIYGLWLTILSVLSWLGLLNGGMGNGLRNKLADAIATKNMSSAKAYVSTSYIFISIIASGCCLVFLLTTVFIDWRIPFNASYILKGEFLTLMLIVVISYFFQLVLSTLNAICFAFNESILPSLFTFLSNLLYVISLYFLKVYNITGLWLLGLTYSLTIVCVLVIANFILFSNKYKEIKPTFKYFNKNYIRTLMGTGIKFFLLEISAVLIFATDSLVITHIVGSKEVTTYQLIMKVFSIFTIVSGSVMVPLWSAYTHAYSTKNTEWIKKTMKKTLLMLIPFIASIAVFSCCVSFIIKIWIGDEIIVPRALVFVIALYIIINIWSNFFAYFLNGINKINLQLITVGSGAVINIPLSFFLGKGLNLGSFGVVLSTVLALLPFAIVGPVTSYLEIKKLSATR